MARYIVVVCGYGTELTPDIQRYLDRVVEYCNCRKPGVIIFSGGITRGKTLPGLSEAKMMRNYVDPRLLYAARTLLDEGAYTSIDNIRDVAQMLQHWSLVERAPVIVVFCEASKRRSIRFLSRHFFGYQVHIRPVDWGMKSGRWQTSITVYTWFAMYVPGLAAILRFVRKWQLSRA